VQIHRGSALARSDPPISPASTLVIEKVTRGTGRRGPSWYSGLAPNEKRAFWACIGVVPLRFSARHLAAGLLGGTRQVSNRSLADHHCSVRSGDKAVDILFLHPCLVSAESKSAGVGIG
jgi:hypothetical protein